MSCSCQTLALRTFVRAVAQVHATPALAQRSLSHGQSLVLSRARRPTPLTRAQATTSIPARGWVRAYSAEAREEAAPAAVASDPASELSDTPDAAVTEPSPVAAEAPPVVGEGSEGAGEIKVESADAPLAAFPKKLKMKKKATKEQRAAEAAAPTTEDANATTLIEGKAATKAKTTRTREKSKPKTKSATKNKRPEEATELEAAAGPIVAQDGAVPAGTTKTNAAQEVWGVQKSALEKKFPAGWSPPKKLSPDAIAGIRTLHAQYPAEYSTEVLAAQFETSPEAIRRILKSRWRPSPTEEEDRQRRWFERGKRVWGQWAATGRKPPLRWRREGVVREPFWNEAMTRSGRPRTEEEIEAHRYAKAQRVQDKINETLL